MQVYAVKVPEGAQSVGMKIREITEKRKFPRDVVFVGIYREEAGDFLIPRGSNTLEEDDTVFVISKSQDIKRATDFLTKTR